jgi:hypothetical protein
MISDLEFRIPHFGLVLIDIQSGIGDSEFEISSPFP